MECKQIIYFILFVGVNSWVVDDYGCRTVDSSSGHCVPQEQCKYIDNFEEKSEFIKEYACGIDGYGKFKVCCPFDTQNTDDEIEIIDHSQHKNIHLIPKDCGRTQAWGIYSGNVSNLFEFGWPVLLKYYKNENPFLCGGTLINNRYILTAANCIKDDLYEVYLGEHDVTNKVDCSEEYRGDNAVQLCMPPVQILKISSRDATIHPKYNPHLLTNDVAVIRLREPIDPEWEETIHPVCLPITREEKSAKNSKYTVVGWGANKYGLASTQLLKVLASKADFLKCSSAYNIRIGKKELCIEGDTVESACASDDGGSLLGYYTSGNKLKTIQYGILSMKPTSCILKKNPTIYTDVSPYVGWILDSLRP